MVKEEKIVKRTERNKQNYIDAKNYNERKKAIQKKSHLNDYITSVLEQLEQKDPVYFLNFRSKIEDLYRLGQFSYNDAKNQSKQQIDLELLNLVNEKINKLIQSMDEIDTKHHDLKIDLESNKQYATLNMNIEALKKQLIQLDINYNQLDLFKEPKKRVAKKSMSDNELSLLMEKYKNSNFKKASKEISLRTEIENENDKQISMINDYKSKFRIKHAKYWLVFGFVVLMMIFGMCLVILG